MNKGFRGINVVIGACLTVAAAQPEVPRAVFRPPKDAQPVSILKIAAVSPSTAALTIYSPPCRDPRIHDQCDLEAQWNAATAARNAADWSWWQMVFSALGLAGLLYNLILTRRTTNVAIAATQDAEEALEIAKLNADGASRAVLAANEGNAIARQSVQTQLRPYLYIEKIEARFDHMLSVKYIGDTADFEILLKNYGQSPARNVRIIAYAAIGDHWSKRSAATLDGVMPFYWDDIPPQATRLQKGIGRDGLKGAHDDIYAGKRSIFVEGQIRYQDASGTWYFSNFQRAYFGEEYYHANDPLITSNWNNSD